jgi:hypothetical protein
LAGRSFPNIRSSRAPTPAPHNDDETAQDNKKNPRQKQDIADLVDIESRSMYGDSEPQDGSNDQQHDPK